MSHIQPFQDDLMEPCKTNNVKINFKKQLFGSVLRRNAPPLTDFIKKKKMPTRFEKGTIEEYVKNTNNLRVLL